MNNQIEKTPDLLDCLPYIEEIAKYYVPVDISFDMINIIPEDVFKPGAKFLDIACKSGRFLKAIFYRLMNSIYMQNGTICGRDDKEYNLTIEDERSNYILREQLFGLALHKSTLSIARRNLYGTLDTDIENIIWVKEYPALVNKKDYKFGDTNIYKILKELLGKKENSDMKIDVVIGNPPYNGGMDLDFVDLGYKLADKCTCMIVPAKWKTAEADQRLSSKNISYGQFREKYMPRMSHICFYPDCKDVFNIMQADGISWFVIEKNETSQCTVDNRLKANSIIDSTVTRDMKNSKTLFNIGEEIIDYLGSYNSFTFSNYKNGRFQVLTNNHAPGGALYAFSKTASKINIIGKSYIRDSQTGKLGYNEVNLPDDATLVFTSDDVNECVSFISWLNTKFVRFFVAINISKLAPMMCNECFKYVPAPEVNENYKYKFDHIYTDEELYKTFNLPQKYIDVIEAVIKERK